MIDHLYRERQHIGRERGEEAQEGLKKVVEKLSQLRYEMQTDKPITNLEDEIGNAHVWNDYLEMRKLDEGSFTIEDREIFCLLFFCRRSLQLVQICLDVGGMLHVQESLQCPSPSSTTQGIRLLATTSVD